MVIVGMLAAVISARFIPHTTLQLQAGRDLLIAALFSAQQKAMSQMGQVRLFTSGSSIDVRLDANGDGNFASNESIRVAGTQFPLTVPGDITLSTHQLDYTHLGHTSAVSIQVSKNSTTLTVTVSGTGYAY
jgi:MSHA pilin protein MshC